MSVPNIDTNVDVIQNPEIGIKNSLLQKFADLMQGVDPNHKVSFISSKIRSFPKCVKARAIVEGDAYLKEFLATLSADELNDLFNSIILSIYRNPQAMDNKKTSDTVNLLMSGMNPKSTHTLVQEAYDAIGDIFSHTARAEENKQYDEANKKFPDRKLEEREYKLCGNPYGQILRENLPHLEIDAISYAKFNRAIRKVLIKYQNGDITLLDLQLRLRYALSQLAICLEQRGFIAAAMQVRRQVFGEAYAGDGLTGVFADQSKVAPKKVRPTLTAEIKARAESYLSKLKASLADVGKFLGLEPKADIKNIATNDINQRVADFIGELEEFPTDEEARRRFLNRVANVRMAYSNLGLDQRAREGIEDDDLFADLPYNYEDLAFAFENHLNKLSQRINPDAENSYFPKPK